MKYCFSFLINDQKQKKNSNDYYENNKNRNFLKAIAFINNNLNNIIDKSIEFA